MDDDHDVDQLLSFSPLGKGLCMLGQRARLHLPNFNLALGCAGPQTCEHTVDGQNPFRTT